jgi:prolyl oligopeptidase
VDGGAEAVTHTVLRAVPGRDWLRAAVARAARCARLSPPIRTHHAVIHVLDADTGRLLPDRPRGTRHESLAWRPDSTRFHACGAPRAGATIEVHGCWRVR